MKKIITAVAAVAMAASMFAVDFAANVHGWTDLFNMDLATDGAKPSFMGVRDPFDRKFAWSSTGIGVSFNGDKGGASFELNGRDVAVENVKVYAQPMDALKITVGAIGLASNCETIDYTKLSAYEGKEGWALDITPIDGLSINTMLVTGEARSWGWAFWGKDGKIGETVAKIGYSAGFGSVFGLVDYADPVTTMTAGYSGNVAGVGLFCDVAYTMAKKANVVAADVFANGAAGPLGYKAYVKYARGLDAKTNALQAKLLLNMGIGSGSGYFKCVIPDAFQKKFPVQIYPGYQFNIGCVSVDAGVQFNFNTDADANAGKGGAKSLSVPVVYKVSL